MNDILSGKWKQAKGEVKRQWSSLTDDDVGYIEGNYDKLVGKLQERYGWNKKDAQREVNQWLDRV